MLARFDLVNLIRGLNAEDAFYYFQIARNLAEGKFSTFDGGITRTNGYHLLWLFLITPFYWVFDKEAALFAIKAFEIMLVAGGVALVAAAARLARMPWYLMFAALPTLYQQHGLLMGMEAAAGLFMLGLFILTACLFARSSARWKWPLAAVAFALPWVRLEYVAISLAATAALCLIEWSRRESLLGAVSGILAYFAYNGIVFGGVIPVSGAIQQMWSERLWEQEGGYSFVQNFREVLQIPAFDHELLVALEVCAYVVLVWWFARRSRGRTDWLLLAFLVCVFGLAVGHLAKFDELNLVERGGNYGWPLVSYGVDYGDKVPLTIEDEAIGRHDGFLRPAFAWVPSPAVSAIAVNDKRWFPLWKDDLLVASLGAGSLFRVRRHGTVGQYAERIEIGWRIRDLTFMPDGRIALLRDSGWVYFLSRSLRYCNEEAQKQRKVYSVNCESIAASPVLDSPDMEYSEPSFPPLGRNPGRDTTAGAQLFNPHCSTCHNLNAEQHGAGPHLVGVIGRRAGEVEGYRFSDAFDSLDVVWTQDSITQFLTDHRPEAVRPGTSMSLPGIGEVEARAIANYISSRNYLEALVRNHEPAVRSDFDVYLGENTLVYVREPCSPKPRRCSFCT